VGEVSIKSFFLEFCILRFEIAYGIVCL